MSNSIVRTRNGQPARLRRSRVHVWSPFKETNRVGTPSKFAISLGKRFTNVQALEVSGFNIPSELSPTFTAPVNGVGGNNKLDVRVQSFLPFGAGSINEFTVTFDTTKRYANYDRLIQYVVDELNVQMAEQITSGDFTIGGWKWTCLMPSPYATSNAAHNLKNRYEACMFALTNDNIFPTGRTAKVTFLFGTGPNRGNGPERVLGFREGVDTTSMSAEAKSFLVGDREFYSPTDNNTDYPFSTVEYENMAISSRCGFVWPFTYADLFVEELRGAVGEQIPIARVFVGNGSLTGSNNRRYDGNVKTNTTLPKPRFFNPPLNKLDNLRIRVQLQNFVEPLVDNFDVAFQLELFTVDTEQVVPEWLKTVLGF
jgi:hypothetical protein